MRPSIFSKPVAACSVVISVIVFASLTGCAGGGSTASNLSYHDLGLSNNTDWKSPKISLRAIQVVAPSWLDTPALQYRLAYASDTRRLNYADSRWVAQPAELLEKKLQRRLVSNTSNGPSNAGSSGCRLRIDLDEFNQVFDQPNTSRVIVEARASLLAAGSEALLARRAFNVERPTASPDATGGIAAFATATDALSVDLRDWLESGVGREAIERCKGA